MKSAQKHAAEGKACIYLTGSFAREEPSKYSDLDLFIVGQTKEIMVGNTKERVRILTKLDEILIKGTLIKISRSQHIPDFSGDGAYLKYYTVDDLIKTLGKPDDDASNTFTARLLLLLESRPLLEEEIYSEIIEKVIWAYWKDYKNREDEFMPSFLVNDILRLWRTFCVNYEARTKEGTEGEKAMRKLKNYKLKHSRLLTCYSALVYLMAIVAQKGTVSPNDAKSMVSLSPLRRLECLKNQPKFSHLSNNINAIIEAYVNFLKKTDQPEEKLIGTFSDKENTQAAFKEAREFGNQVFELLVAMSDRNPLYKYLLV